MIGLIFPRKCLLCEKILTKHEMDLCQACQEAIEPFPEVKNTLSFVAGWTAMWYYKENVRHGILRYKFYGKRNRGKNFGRLLAMHLLQRNYTDFDVLTWVPLSAAKFRKRGYDQVEQIGKSVSRELGHPLTPTLKKIRDTSTQSTLQTTDARRANVLGAYIVTDPEAVKDKRILLLEDVITTGATASECAKTLLFSGAKEVYCAALAAINPEKKQNNR